jgi:hypothetical protein
MKYHFVVLKSPAKLIFVVKANDNNTWWTYLICCAAISLASGIAVPTLHVYFSINGLVPSTSITHFVTHMAERNHEPFLFSQGNFGLLYVIHVVVCRYHVVVC